MLSILAASLVLVPSQAIAHDPQLKKLCDTVPGRIGVCIQTSTKKLGYREEERFSLQSVAKLVVSAAVLNRIDRRQESLETRILVTKADTSAGIQPLAKLVQNKGKWVTIGELIRRSVIDSDSMAFDILFSRIGRQPTVAGFLHLNNLDNIRVDRKERDLQTETVGLTWRDAYRHQEKLSRAISDLSTEQRKKALHDYQLDVRDTATPLDLTTFLLQLADHKLLFRKSTDFLRHAMADCKTFPDRLKAGVPKGWRLEHKTGTSYTYEGLTVATNDVGILVGPKGQQVAITVMIGDSTATEMQRNMLFQKLAAFATKL